MKVLFCAVSLIAISPDSPEKPQIFLSEEPLRQGS